MNGVLGRVWVAAGCLCAGTVAGAAGVASVVGMVVATGGAMLLLVRRRPALTITALAALALGAGIVNAQLRLVVPGPLAERARDVPSCTFETVVLERAGAAAVVVAVRSARCDGWSGTSLGVAAIADEVAPPGSVAEVDGWLMPLPAGNFGISLARSGARALIRPRHMQLVAEPVGGHAVAQRVRVGLAEAVSRLAPRAGGLIKGLTIGDTSELGAATVDLFRNAGLSHIVAVSGSNVAIVVGSVLVALRAAGFRARIAFGYLALGLFVLVVGPDPSVVRAAAMGAIALACLAYGRISEPLAALGLAIVAVVGLRPGMVFSVGLQLSAAATAGIVLFSGPLERTLHRLPAGLRTMLAATLAAQVAVSPILILVFGEISVVAPISNALALPAVAPATVIGLAAGLSAIVLPPVGQVLALVVSPAVEWVLFVGDRTGSLPWALARVPHAAGWPLLVLVAAGAAAALRGAAGPAR